MIFARLILRSAVALAVCVAACPQLFAAERVTLRNGAEFVCIRREPAGNRVRLYLFPAASPSARAAVSGLPPTDDASYVEVAAASILRVEIVPDPPFTALTPHPDSQTQPHNSATPLTPAPLTQVQMRRLLTSAGNLHNIDVDLLASIVHAESNGNTLAVSRAGARGLMQLMPSTASSLDVQDSFAPAQNIGGGAAYLDQLLTRYHNDIRLAVAAYNAGPAAVDRYHGIPPFAETRAYVARVVREFNRRKLAEAARPTTAPASLVASR